MSLNKSDGERTNNDLENDFLKYFIQERTYNDLENNFLKYFIQKRQVIYL